MRQTVQGKAMISSCVTILLWFVFGVGAFWAAVNICCMAQLAYLHYVKQDKRNRTALPPLGSGLMCVSLYFLGSSHFLLPLLFDYPFPLLLIIPAVKTYRLMKG